VYKPFRNEVVHSLTGGRGMKTKYRIKRKSWTMLIHLLCKRSNSNTRYSLFSVSSYFPVLLAVCLYCTIWLSTHVWVIKPTGI